MNNLADELSRSVVLDDQMREKIIIQYQNRGRKALDIIDQNRVKRYRDFFVVVGETGEYVVEDEYCSCEDFLRRNLLCSHILAVFIARATGRYEMVDLWYYQDLKGPGN